MRRAVCPDPLTPELPNEHRGLGSHGDHPPGGQPLVRGHRRGHSDVHGSRGHDGGQRGAALHCRRAVGGGHRQRMGYHRLPGRQRLHPADHRLAFGPHRPPQLFSALDCRLYPRLGALRHGCQPSATDPVPRLRAWPAADSRPPVRRSCWTAFRARNKAQAQTMFGVAALLGPVVGPTLGGWLVDTYNWRSDFLYQPPGRPVRLPGLLRPAGKPALPQRGAGGVEEAAVELRRHRPGTAGAGHGHLGNRAQQRAGVGLAGRSVLAGADAAARVPVGTGGPDLSRTAVCQPGG